MSVLMAFYNQCTAYYTVARSLFVMRNKVQKKSQLLHNIGKKTSYTLGDQDLVEIFRNLASYKPLRLSTVMLLGKSICNKRNLSHKSKHKFDCLDRACERIDNVLDIETLVDMQHNVNMLLRLVLNRKQRWLLRHFKFGQLMRTH